MLDDMLIHTRWSRQTEHDATPLDNLGHKRGRLHIACSRLPFKSLLQIIEPFEFQGESMCPQIGRDRNVRKAIENIVNIGHRAAEALRDRANALALYSRFNDFVAVDLFHLRSFLNLMRRSKTSLTSVRR